LGGNDYHTLKGVHGTSIRNRKNSKNSKKKRKEQKMKAL
jgi:hypothetical protein